MNYEPEQGKSSRDKEIVALKKRLQELATSYKIIREDIKKNILIFDDSKKTTDTPKKLKAAADTLKAAAAKVQAVLNQIFDLREAQGKASPAPTEKVAAAALQPLITTLKSGLADWVMAYGEIVGIDEKFAKQLDKKKQDMQILQAQCDAAMNGEYQGVFRPQSKDGAQIENSSKQEVADLKANNLTPEKATYLAELRECYTRALATYNGHDCKKNPNLKPSSLNIDKAMLMAEKLLATNKFNPADFTLTKVLFAKISEIQAVANIIHIYTKGYPMPDATKIGLKNAPDDAPKPIPPMSAYMYFKKFGDMLQDFFENIVMVQAREAVQRMGGDEARKGLSLTEMGLIETNLAKALRQEAKKEYDTTGVKPDLWKIVRAALITNYKVIEKPAALVDAFFKPKFHAAMKANGLLGEIAPPTEEHD